MKNLKTWLVSLWPDSHFWQLVLAMLLGAAVLQGINMYAVCHIQHSYNNELHKVRYDYDSSIYLAMVNMDNHQRQAYLGSLDKAQSSLSQPAQFQVSTTEPNWPAESSPYANDARQALRSVLAISTTVELPLIKTRVLNQPETGIPASGQAGRLNPLLQTAIELDSGSRLEILQPLYITNRGAVWVQRAFILLESVLFSILLIWMIRRVHQTASPFGPGG